MAYSDPERYREAKRRSYKKWQDKRRQEARDYWKKLRAEQPEKANARTRKQRDNNKARLERMKAEDPENYAKYRAVQAHKLRVYRDKVRRESPSLHMWREVKRRAVHSCIDFSIDPSDVVIPERCPALGIPLAFNVGSQVRSEFSPSLDRIDPRKGYVKGNVQVLSNKANTMKNSATPEELVAFARWVLSLHGDFNELPNTD